MNAQALAIPGYGDDIARGYDAKSEFDKGHREAHRALVVDLVRRLCPQPRMLLDLGCGTGYFTGALLDAFPGANAVCLDGSADMLAVAQARLGAGRRAQFVRTRFEDIHWPDFEGGFNVAFSALAIHHLAHADKWALFRRVHESLAPGGLFILIDQFLHESPEHMELLEYLACSDIRRRIVDSLGAEPAQRDLDIDTLVRNDRRMRAEEGDKDAPLAEQLRRIEAAGFPFVLQFMQETRYFGCVARKAP